MTAYKGAEGLSGQIRPVEVAKSGNSGAGFIVEYRIDFGFVRFERTNLRRGHRLVNYDRDAVVDELELHFPMVLKDFVGLDPDI